MDRPLRLAAWITFHLAICKGAGFLGTEVAFLSPWGNHGRGWGRSLRLVPYRVRPVLSPSDCPDRYAPAVSVSWKLKGQSMTGWGFVKQVSYDLKQPESVRGRGVTRSELIPRVKYP